MADETTQAGEETSWWVFDAFADSELPSTSFDEPLEWPDTLEWGDVGDADAELRFPGGYDLSEPIFPVSGDVQTATPAEPAEPLPETPNGDGEPTIAVPLAGLGGGAAPVGRRPGAHSTSDRLPDSIWAPDRHASDTISRPAASALGGATTMVAELDGNRPGGWRRRFDLRHGNAAVIALISFVSLVLLGMFLSVRARNDVPTDSSQTRTTSDQIAVQGTLNTVPLNIPNTTLGPPSTINIADLVPAAEDATNAGQAAGSGSTAATTGTTAAPRATTATTQPAAQATNTTAATAPTTVATTTPTTAAPVDTTTVTTRPRPTTPTTPTSITLPSIPGFTWPPGFND
jgi:hypothetical protein